MYYSVNGAVFVDRFRESVCTRQIRRRLRNSTFMIIARPVMEEGRYYIFIHLQYILCIHYITLTWPNSLFISQVLTYWIYISTYMIYLCISWMSQISGFCHSNNWKSTIYIFQRQLYIWRKLGNNTTTWVLISLYIFILR